MRHRGRFVVGNHAEGELLALAPIAKPDVFVKREIAVASLLHSFDVARADAVILQSHQTILDFMAFSRVSASHRVRRLLGGLVADKPAHSKEVLKEKQTKCL